jgi:hypothetical protein
MAQTRAISKSIKGILGFVVVMAGYSDTPAEEMPRAPRKRSSQKTVLPGESFEDVFDESHKSGESPTSAKLKRLDMLIVKLRESGRLHTEHLYAAVGKMRDMEHPEDLQGMPNAIDAEGVLHWGPLRATLSKGEAESLIDRLAKLQAAS